MPRNATGTYTLPAGNPVVTGTIIDVAWANPTLSDVGSELTNSLDRQGRGGMQAPLQNVDGTVSAPAYTFISEPGLGFRRVAAANVGLAVASKDVWQIVTDAVLTSEHMVPRTDGGTRTVWYNKADLNNSSYGVAAIDATHFSWTAGKNGTGVALPYRWKDAAGTALMDLTQAGNLTTLGTINAGRVVPPGAVMDFAMNAPPAGWFECNGAAVSRTTYAALFAAIGTVFGVGDGSTTFNLPDARGRFTRSWDNGAGRDAGRVFGSVQAGDNLSHLHSVSITSSTVSNDHTHTGTTSTSADHAHTLVAGGTARLLRPDVGGGANFGAGPASTSDVSSTDLAGAHNHTMTTGGISANHTHGVTGNTGATGTETRPINIAFLTCIAT